MCVIGLFGGIYIITNSLSDAPPNGFSALRNFFSGQTTRMLKCCKLVSFGGARPRKTHKNSVCIFSNYEALCWLWHYKCHSCQPNGVIGSSFRVQLGQALSLLSLSPPPLYSHRHRHHHHHHHHNLWPSSLANICIYDPTRGFGYSGCPAFSLARRAVPNSKPRKPRAKENIKRSGNEKWSEKCEWEHTHTVSDIIGAPREPLMMSHTVRRVGIKWLPTWASNIFRDESKNMCGNSN